jgi:GDP-4-dehydro-6-deoxy-D-mannose reductase
VRVLVTGAAGFVGAHLCTLAAAQPGWSVIAVSHRPRPSTDPRLDEYHLDVLDAPAITDLLGSTRPEAIVHLASQSSVAQSLRDPAGTLTTNVLGLLNLLEGCRATNLDPAILVIGSAEEYGASARHHAPLTEECPLEPLNPYAVSKVAQEVLGLQYQRAFGLRVICARPFNQIGPGQRPGFVMADFAQQVARIEAGRQPPVLRVGNLAAQRDFLDVRDVCRAYLLALQSGRPGAVYNIGSGQAHSVRSMLDLLLARTAVAIQVEHDAARDRPVDIPLLVADASRFQAATGWRPSIPIERTVADILAAWRAIVGQPTRREEAPV